MTAMGANWPSGARVSYVRNPPTAAVASAHAPNRRSRPTRAASTVWTGRHRTDGRTICMPEQTFTAADGADVVRSFLSLRKGDDHLRRASTCFQFGLDSGQGVVAVGGGDTQRGGFLNRVCADTVSDRTSPGESASNDNRLRFDNRTRQPVERAEA